MKMVIEHTGFDENNKHQWEVVKEAYACCIDISRKLYTCSVGLPWIIGTGYNSAWTLLHHAEEAMIEVADVETTVRGAKHDFLAIRRRWQAAHSQPFPIVQTLASGRSTSL